jgi:hypothetical protein
MLSILALGVLPIVLLTLAFTHWRANGTLAWDFHHELYPQAQTMLDGDNPYPSATHDPATGTNRVWPPAAVLVVAPLTLLPAAAADLLIGLLGLGCFAAALWVVGTRDWRVYGVVALWPPVFIEPGLAHLTPMISLLVALTWRNREAGARSGLVAGLAVAVKFFIWPLLVWLAATRRPRAACFGALVAATSLLLVLPFTGLTAYVESVLRVGRVFDQDTYTVFGILVQSGAAEPVARVVTLVAAGTLLWGTWRYRSFTLAIATALVASPIVWLDYFAIAAIPLAIVRPRLSPIWFVPLLTIGLDGAGLELGDALGTFRALAAFAVVLGVAFRAERIAYPDRETVPANRATPLSAGVSADPRPAARRPA